MFAAKAGGTYMAELCWDNLVEITAIPNPGTILIPAVGFAPRISTYKGHLTLKRSSFQCLQGPNCYKQISATDAPVALCNTKWVFPV
jgi:hypothetical protein